MTNKERLDWMQNQLPRAVGQFKADLTLMLAPPKPDMSDYAERRAASARLSARRRHASGKTREARNRMFGAECTSWNVLCQLLDALPELVPPSVEVDKAKAWRSGEWSHVTARWPRNHVLDHLAEICAELGPPTADGCANWAMGPVPQYDRAYAWVEWHGHPRA